MQAIVASRIEGEQTRDTSVIHLRSRARGRTNRDSIYADDPHERCWCGQGGRHAHFGIAGSDDRRDLSKVGRSEVAVEYGQSCLLAVLVSGGGQAGPP